ncbi:MAG: type II secretion system protein [Oscillospiraceae bacterium]|nr:type II secretion system protein [Oscillospiraceae bacterium]
MKTRRNTEGFTLLELALAVAIIAILSGVTAVNVVHYQRTLTQVELDGIAREIFVAAQNHLTMAESQNFMGIDPDSDSDWGELYQVETDTTPEIRYYVAEHIPARNALNMLNLMLPFASVDETVLKSGSYVIRYQKNPALVLDVFYAAAEKTETGETVNRKFTYTFTETEAEGTLWDYCGNDKKQERGDYGTNHAIIGWYGVDPEWFSTISGGTPTPVKKGEPLSPPTVKIVNAEQLYVEVTNPNLDKDRWDSPFKTARLHLEITGVQSGKKCTPIELIDNSGYPVDENHYITHKELYSNNPYLVKTYRVILDDVTQANTRFYKMMEEFRGNLYPGEDIVIRAVAYNNTELTNIATSASATTNSLFASVDGSAADIANFRHLENLDSNISYVGSNPSTAITKAKQTSDMYWDKFVENVKKLKKKEKIAETVEVYSDTTHSKDGYYLPIENQEQIEYIGTITDNLGNRIRAAKISNVKIDVSGNAGLFAKLGHSSTVTDLELVNFSVKSSGGNAGALAGVLEVLEDDSKVQRVLVHHDIDPNLSKEKQTIQGSSSTGGLIGKIALGEIPADKTPGACIIEQSAAAVYVTSGEGDAGGLIGAIDNESGTQVTVSDSYAGGHVITKKDDDEKEIGVEYNNNVTAKKNAGGLIGSSAGTSTASLTVQNCYATTSVKADENAGGLIGDVKGGTIENCYVTGYVEGGNYAGAFAGEATDATTRFTNARYLSIITGKLPNVGNIEDHPNVSKLDDSLADYLSYTPCTNGAKPYNDTLRKFYGGKYMFKTISQLHDSGAYTADWMTTHYGDWPMETQVINTK